MAIMFYMTAVVLTIMKLTESIAVSWWLIAGIAFTPLAFAITFLVAGIAATAYLTK